MAGKLIKIDHFNTRYKIFKKVESKFMDKFMQRDIYIPHGMYYNINRGKKNSISIIHNKCLISNRSRATINKFKMSRMIFKKYSEFSFLNGIRRASW